MGKEIESWCVTTRTSASVSGPLGDSAGYRATVNYYETDGFLHNELLNESVDPVESLSARSWTVARLICTDTRSAGRCVIQAASHVVGPKCGDLEPCQGSFATGSA